MTDTPAPPPTGGGPQQEVRIDGDRIIALAQTIAMASDLLEEHILQAVINHMLDRERTAPLDPRLPPDAVHGFRHSRRVLEALRTFKTQVKAAREAPQLSVVPQVILPGGRA